jgi:hypothetical protein
MANTDPVYVTINDRPRSVLQVLDGLVTRRQQHQAATARRSRLPRYLFFASLPFFALDWLLGYNFLTFTLVGAALVIASLVTAISLRRARLAPAFPPNFDTAREVIHTLRDDPDPRRGLFGHIDFTGYQQPAKKFREGKNAAGRAVDYYRDEWLSLKAKLYDGNMLRVAAIERVKVRRSYWKRSAISGKTKLKPAKVGAAQQLKVRLSVNPEIYTIVARNVARPGSPFGQYTLTEISAADGIVDLTAGTSSKNVRANDILPLLRLAYQHLERKA